MVHNNFMGNIMTPTKTNPASYPKCRGMKCFPSQYLASVIVGRMVGNFESTSFTVPWKGWLSETLPFIRFWNSCQSLNPSEIIAQIGNVRFSLFFSPARWGLWDFMSDARLLLLVVISPFLPPRRTSASSWSQWASPDHHCQLSIAVGLAGPQLLPRDRCGPRRTSAGESLSAVGLAGLQPARVWALWASPDFNNMSERRLDRMSEDIPDRMSEDMPDRMPDRECQKICQIECQKILQTECQKIWQTECQKIRQIECQIGCRKIWQIDCQKIWQIECKKICQIECQKICQIECQKICQIERQKICQRECQKIFQIECQIENVRRLSEDLPDRMNVR